MIKGKVPLKGEVRISGAKNAVLGILAAAIMADETVTVENVPDVNDSNVVLEALADIGAKVKHTAAHTVEIDGSTISNYTVDYESIRRIRASYYLIGALLGKYKEAKVALPGGCDIGSRPIDLHIKGFKALGAEVEILPGGFIYVKADKLTGANIFFDTVSVGATINLMLAACMAEGDTILENAAKEPHIVDVANFLNAMGANIKGAGTDIIRIKGVEKLHGTTYSIIPDQIEAGTFMIAAAVTGGDVTVCDVIPKHLESISAKLIEMGCTIEEGDETVRVIAPAPERLKATNIKTLPYPGFPTDMQSQMMACLCTAHGESSITENIFENRFKIVPELIRMGADISVSGSKALLSGSAKLHGEAVAARDLRGGAALVAAGLAAEGTTIVQESEYIDRGYVDVCSDLRSLGACIDRRQ